MEWLHNTTKHNHPGKTATRSAIPPEYASVQEYMLYDEHENANVRFVGMTTDDYRYDFGIVYTNMFFGKPLVFCMQTGRSTLLDLNDLLKIETLQKTFQLPTLKEASQLALFLEEILPFSTSPEAQYE